MIRLATITPPRTREPSPRSVCSKYSRSELDHAEHVRRNVTQQILKQNGQLVILDGNQLDVVQVVAVAENYAAVKLSKDDHLIQKIDKSIETLNHHLEAGSLVYGVTTGFGGSADTRTLDLKDLQRALLQMQNSGILTSADLKDSYYMTANDPALEEKNSSSDWDSQAMPTSWVRASMVVRCNSLVRGHSAVRLLVVETILKLLEYNIIPIVPLRGSISASGDLSPLSYIAGVVEGNPDIFVRVGKARGRIMNARAALKAYGIPAIEFQAKEGLGVLNGTAFSAATAALTIVPAQEFAVYAQILTAMGVEAMQGMAESFDPRIAQMRPHPGQVESAANILSFLTGSKLAHKIRASGQDQDQDKEAGLCQDRYAWRTASQWIGPQLEDLLQAQKQIEVELNSTTDNPLIDADTQQILHGGNFQAAVVTSTMDRARLAIEKLGRLLFVQATEMINPAMNKGLPANLSSDDITLSFTCKGVDINMAAYASELGFLANPVGNHVVSAEMHNQAINSLALLSSRYTFQALDVLRMMVAAYLFVVCQALDLRVLQQEFLRALPEVIGDVVKDTLSSLDQQERQKVSDIIWAEIYQAWPNTAARDLEGRCTATASAITENLMQHFTQADHDIIDLHQLKMIVSKVKTGLQETYEKVRQRMYEDHIEITSTYLGNASRVMYNYIRSTLGLKFHRGLIEHPTVPVTAESESESEVEAESKATATTTATDTTETTEKPTTKPTRRTIGTQISIIYEALRDGKMRQPLMTILDQTLDAHETA